jgi:hypothetical protein
MFHLTLISFLLMREDGVILTEAIISQRTRLSLPDVRKLNLWGHNLTDVSLIAKMPNLEVVSLSCNQISSLKPFASCHSLTDLSLRDNQISDFAEIRHLAALPHLRVLWLSDNPISSDPHYRERVLHLLPKLTKLDDREVPKPRSNLASRSLPLPKIGRPARDDQGLLAAVLALLPELSPMSLKIVLETIVELSQ